MWRTGRAVSVGIPRFSRPNRVKVPTAHIILSEGSRLSVSRVLVGTKVPRQWELCISTPSRLGVKTDVP